MRFALITFALGAAGCASMTDKFASELVSTQLNVSPNTGGPVTQADLALLPATAQRYLNFMGVVGRPRDWSFRAHFKGRFRSGRDADWKVLDSIQYNSGVPEVARLFYMTLPFYGVPVQGRDTYVRGKGRLLIRPLDLFTVQDGVGTEFDLGELVTWVNDAVLMAPSMLLVPAATWQEVNDTSFDIIFTDRGNTVTSRVFVDERGAVTDFHTRDRWMSEAGSKDPPVRALWTTPVSGWQLMNGRMLAAQGRAVWKLPDGDLPYGEFHQQPGDVVFNVLPGDLRGL